MNLLLIIIAMNLHKGPAWDCGELIIVHCRDHRKPDPMLLLFTAGALPSHMTGTVRVMPVTFPFLSFEKILKRKMSVALFMLEMW